MRKPVVGVMGASAGDGLTKTEQMRLSASAELLGRSLARLDCFLVTGATTGIPSLVAQAFRQTGGFALGISPAINHDEHVRRYALPDDGADLIVYTGFGLKGRNVINIRSSDIVIIFGGATGTLNEFTIAYDEGKIIGVLEGSGGVADQIRGIVAACNKSSACTMVYGRDPESLLEECLEQWALRQKSHLE